MAFRSYLFHDMLYPSALWLLVETKYIPIGPHMLFLYIFKFLQEESHPGGRFSLICLEVNNLPTNFC